MPLRRGLPLLAVVAVFFGGLVGCGDASEPATPTAVADAYRSWDDAAISGDAATACPRMTDRFVKAEIARSGSKAKDCKGLIKEVAVFARAHPEIKNYKLSQIEIAGDRATLTDQTPYENVIDTARMALIREDGRWKVDSQEIVEETPQERPSAGGLES